MFELAGTKRSGATGIHVGGSVRIGRGSRSILRELAAGLLISLQARVPWCYRKIRWNISAASLRFCHFRNDMAIGEGQIQLACIASLLGTADDLPTRATD